MPLLQHTEKRDEAIAPVQYKEYLVVGLDNLANGHQLLSW